MNQQVTFEIRGAGQIQDFIVEVENLPFFVDEDGTLTVWGGDIDDLPLRHVADEPDEDGVEVEVTVTDEDIVKAKAHSSWVAGQTLTMKDASSKPFAWITEGWMDDMYILTLQDAKQVALDYFVNGTVANQTEWEYDFDADAAFEVLCENEAVVETLQEYAEDWMLEQVMTTQEIAEEYGIADATVRQTINRDAIRARKSGSTWLILRSDAERFWNRSATKGVTTWLVTVLAVLAIVSQL